jgi:mRNA interferase MazF
MESSYPQARRGDVWLADLGQTSGSEQRGIRPIMVIQNNIGNRHSPTIIAAAVTGQNKKHLPTHAALKKGSRGLQRDSIILLEQIRTLDRARLLKYLGRLDADEIREVDGALAISVGLAEKFGY